MTRASVRPSAVLARTEAAKAKQMLNKHERARQQHWRHPSDLFVVHGRIEHLTHDIAIIQTDANVTVEPHWDAVTPMGTTPIVHKRTTARPSAKPSSPCASGTSSATATRTRCLTRTASSPSLSHCRRSSAKRCTRTTSLAG